MPIGLAPTNKEMRVVRILADDKTKKHLESLGILVNSLITVISSVNGGVVIAVKEGRLAKVEVEGVNLVKQHISCGYATIEMMSEFYGDKVTEDNLDKKNNGGVSTSSTKGFYNEINDSIKNKEFVSKTYLKNDVLLKEIHASLKNNNPVAIEWAAKYEDEWTLHFSLVTSLDLNGDNATVYNPYGYIETLNISEFLDRTTFEAFESMPLFLNFGFAFGAFDKNAIFYLK